ncbi:PREDICTED: trichohyalin-like [Camelina sativa]|uniref:Trichohyalin-like n=1 Tax=Camelina sativa TaxID=90675 RepID=A0ABM0UV29_CAMSA|nr:PREDICTED: trichohyalin-like [Camelina sativa]
MENLTHPRNPNKSSSSSSSSLPKKKPYNGLTPGGGFTYTNNSSGNTTTSTTYDDVFGGPPRFGAPTLSPRLEDYCEIFSGSSRAAVSSIPVLDLPLVDGRDVYFDVRTQGFDYREVFGGFNDLDLAPSYEDLFFQQRSTTVVGLCDSSDDAWTPEEVESCSGGTEHSGKSPCFSNGRDSYDSIDGSTEFNISYNKASHQLSSSGVDTNMSSGGVIRVAAVDEMICAGGTTKETGPSSVVGSRGTTSRFVFEDKYYNNCEPFVTVSEIGLKTHPTGIPPPSRPPPVLKSGFRSSASNSRTTGSEGSGGSSSSPPFFDVEVDASSAAVREAMVKAEAKLKNSKELFERKRDGVRTTTKSRMTDVGKPSHTAGLRDNKHGSKSLSSQGSGDSDEWKEANQFVELVRTELPRNADENSGGKDVCIPVNAEFFDQELTWGANVDWEKQRRRAKGDREDHEAGKLPKHPGTRKVPSRHKRHENKLAEKAPEEPKNEKSGHVELQFEMGNNLPDHDGIVKHRNLLRPEENKVFTEKPAKQKKELHRVEKTKRIQNQQLDRKPHQKAAEKNQAFEWEQNARKLREALGNESMLEVSLELNGNDKKLGIRGESETKLNEALKRVEEETRIKEARVKEENERREREAFEKAEHEKRLKAALEQEEKEKKIKVAREKEENERRVAEAREKAEQERKLKEQQELELRLKEASEREEENRRMREAHEKAENEKKMKVAFEQEKERRIKEAREKEENERRIKEALEKAERRLKETLEQEKKERQIKEFQAREENERRAKEALEQAEKERRLKQALEQKEKEKSVKEAREKEENEKRLKEAMELEEKEKRLIEAFERAEIERRLKEDLEQEERRMKLQEAEEKEERERTHRENQEHQENERKQHEYSGEESDEKERDACEMEKTCETTTEVHGEQSSNESLSDSLEEDESIDNDESVTNQKEEEEEGPSQRESMSEETCPWKVFEKNLKDASQKEGTSELDVGSRLFERHEEAPQLSENGGYKQQNGESGERSYSENIRGGKHKQKSKNSDTSEEASVLKRDNGLKTEVEERSEDVIGEEENARKAVGAGSDQRNPEDSKCAPKTSSGFRNHENKFPQQQERGSIYETQASLNQDAKLEKPLPFRVSVQREKEVERLKRERDFEMERLRKIEEEREREREREKDRMAFDQRALADARERLEKACAEAREKSLPDKSSIEARLRAERAAVERATAEARERAAEKAAFEARERMERSVSDKQLQSSGFFGERMERSVSDKQFQNSVSFGASRYQNSPGTDGESPQRYTSRLERHRRTADRVAKALAEKNMRDLVAQREQAERIRVAETLDAEVKRWSSGKEGNIRALLSTLQYILGPESGWQPLPLTEVITSAAVKRAYRKATLCVHPDKLQQRGANIHQKYICEKVFDLLKEAWNRFNSEER